MCQNRIVKTPDVRVAAILTESTFVNNVMAEGNWIFVLKPLLDTFTTANSNMFLNMWRTLSSKYLEASYQTDEHRLLQSSLVSSMITSPMVSEHVESMLLDPVIACNGGLLNIILLHYNQCKHAHTNHQSEKALMRTVKLLVELFEGNESIQIQCGAVLGEYMAPLVDVLGKELIVKKKTKTTKNSDSDSGGGEKKEQKSNEDVPDILIRLQRACRWLDETLWTSWALGGKDGVRSADHVNILQKFAKIVHTKLHVQEENVVQVDENNSSLEYYGYYPVVPKVKGSKYWIAKTLIYDVLTEGEGLLLSFRCCFGVMNAENHQKDVEFGLGIFQKVSDVVEGEKKEKGKEKEEKESEDEVLDGYPTKFARGQRVCAVCSSSKYDTLEKAMEEKRYEIRYHRNDTKYSKYVEENAVVLSNNGDGTYRIVFDNGEVDSFVREDFIFPATEKTPKVHSGDNKDNKHAMKLSEIVFRTDV